MLMTSSLLFYSHHSKNNLPLSYLADVSTLIIILAKLILSYRKISISFVINSQVLLEQYNGLSDHISWSKWDQRQ